MCYDPIFTLLPLPGDAMDRTAGPFRIPASSVSFANTAGVLVSVAAYDIYVAPAAARAGRPITTVARIGYGYIVAITALLSGAAYFTWLWDVWLYWGAHQARLPAAPRGRRRARAHSCTHNVRVQTGCTTSPSQPGSLRSRATAPSRPRGSLTSGARRRRRTLTLTTRLRSSRSP